MHIQKPGIIRKKNPQKINKFALKERQDFIFIKHCKFTFFLFLIYACCFNYIYSNDNSREIIKLLTQGNTPTQIILQCKNWLLKNQDNSEYYDILMYYYSIEDNITTLITLMHDSLEYITDNHRKGEIYKKTAELEELMGTLQAAQLDYRKASLLLPVPDAYDAIINTARLLYEQGFNDTALIELAKIPDTQDNNEISSKKLTLEGIIAYTAGDIKKAENLFELIVNKYRGTGNIPVVLEYYIKLLIDVKKNDAADQLVELLKTQYEKSPEALYFSQNKNITLLPRPHALFNKTTIVISEESAPAPKGKETMFIQTGSFTVKENAEYMILDLEKKGFSAFYIEKIIDTEKYFAVLAQMTNHYNTIDSFYEALKNNGFSGFKVVLSNLPDTQSGQELLLHP